MEDTLAIDFVHDAEVVDQNNAKIAVIELDC
jgi:hypothetical protein